MSIESQYNKMKGWVEEYLAVSRMLEGSAGNAVTVTHDFGDAVTEWGKVMKDFKKVLPDMNGSIEMLKKISIKDLSKDGLKGGVKALKDDFKGWLKGLEDISKSIDGPVNAAKEIFNTGKSIFEKGKEAYNQKGVAGLALAMGKELSSIVDLQAVADSVSRVLGNIDLKKMFSGKIGLGGFFKEVGSFFKNLGDIDLGKIDFGRLFGNNGLEGMFKGLGDFFKNFGDFDFGKLNLGKIDFDRLFGSDGIGSFFKKLSDLFEKEGGVSSLIKKVFGKEGLGKAIKNGIKNIKTLDYQPILSDAGKSVDKFIRNSVTAVVEGWGSMKDFGKSVAKGDFRGMGQAVSKIWEKGTGIFEGAFRAIPMLRDPLSLLKIPGFSKKGGSLKEDISDFKGLRGFQDVFDMAVDRVNTSEGLQNSPIAAQLRGINDVSGGEGVATSKGVSIGKLVEKIEINVTDLNDSAVKIKDAIIEALVEAVHDVAYAK